MLNSSSSSFSSKIVRELETVQRYKGSWRASEAAARINKFVLAEAQNEKLTRAAAMELSAWWEEEEFLAVCEVTTTLEVAAHLLRKKQAAPDSASKVLAPLLKAGNIPRHIAAWGHDPAVPLICLAAEASASFDAEAEMERLHIGECLRENIRGYLNVHGIRKYNMPENWVPWGIHIDGKWYRECPWVEAPDSETGQKRLAFCAAIKEKAAALRQLALNEYETALYRLYRIEQVAQFYMWFQTTSDGDTDKLKYLADWSVAHPLRAGAYKNITLYDWSYNSLDNTRKYGYQGTAYRLLKQEVHAWAYWSVYKDSAPHGVSFRQGAWEISPDRMTATFLGHEYSLERLENIFAGVKKSCNMSYGDEEEWQLSHLEFPLGWWEVSAYRDVLFPLSQGRVLKQWLDSPVTGEAMAYVWPRLKALGWDIGLGDFQGIPELYKNGVTIDSTGIHGKNPPYKETRYIDSRGRIEGKDVTKELAEVVAIIAKAPNSWLALLGTFPYIDKQGVMNHRLPSPQPGELPGMPKLDTTPWGGDAHYPTLPVAPTHEPPWSWAWDRYKRARKDYKRMYSHHTVSFKAYTPEQKAAVERFAKETDAWGRALAEWQEKKIMEILDEPR